jgi:hypothetical protein
VASVPSGVQVCDHSRGFGDKRLKLLEKTTETSSKVLEKVLPVRASLPHHAVAALAYHLVNREAVSLAILGKKVFMLHGRKPGPCTRSLST